MLKRNLWKILLTAALMAWSVSELLPLKDIRFVDYVRTHATAKPTEFAKLLEEAAARTKNLQASTDFVALKQIGKERRIDLTQYFPDIELEESLRNIEKRNDILLAELLRRSKARLQLGLDLAGGVAFTLEAVDEPGAKEEDQYLRREKIAKAIDIISTRINSFGVAEPVIRQVGENRIEVQLPGVNTHDNPDIVDNVKAPARLDFRVVHPFLTPGTGVETPAGYEIMTLDYEGRRGETGTEELFIKRIPEMTGESMSNAFARPDMYGKPEVILEFTKEGRQRFAQVTRQIAQFGQQSGRMGRLAIVLDGKLYSAPTVREEIDSPSAQITGNFTDREALNLANVLNNPLDVELRVMEQYEVGPTLAKDAVESGKLAFIIGTSLTAGFMVLFYSIGGVLAVLAMLVNVLIMFGVMANFGATLTLPGIAGIVLTLAMSVDSNILIFERMREELRAGKNLPAALSAGYDKAFSAIFDGNITTLITAGIMAWLGTGPIRGFGITLAIGIFTTMFAALIVSRVLLELVIDTGAIKRLPMISVLQNASYNILKYSKAAFIGTAIVVVAGLGTILVKGSAVYGIDFLGGDQVTLTFKQKVSDLGQIRSAAAAGGVTDINPAYRTAVGSDAEVLVVQAPEGKAGAIVEALQQKFPASGFQVAGETRIGASVGKEIQWNAAWSLFWALLLMLLYVAVRFEIGYGIGAVVAILAGLLLTISVFVIGGRQFNASMVAAILLVVGYGINDTIVIFDRIREELKVNPVGTLRDIVTRALNLTLSRTIVTGGTTLLTALTFLLVTKGDVNDISYTLLWGVLISTFCSLFIASPVFYWWHKGDRKHVEAHHDIAPKYEWQGSSKASE